MTNKKIAKIILDSMDFDTIVYALQESKEGQEILESCGYDFDELVYWAQENE